MFFFPASKILPDFPPVRSGVVSKPAYLQAVIKTSVECASASVLFLEQEVVAVLRQPPGKITRAEIMFKKQKKKKIYFAFLVSVLFKIISIGAGDFCDISMDKIRRKKSI